MEVGLRRSVSSSTSGSPVLGFLPNHSAATQAPRESRFTASLQAPTRTSHPAGWCRPPTPRVEAWRVAPPSPRVDGGSMIVLLTSEGRIAFSLAASPAAAPEEPSRTYPGRTGTGGHAHRTRLCMSPVPPVRCRCDLEPTSAPLGASESSSVTSKGGILLLSALKDCYEDGFR